MAKQGLDDYIASGKTIDDLMALVSTELPKPVGGNSSDDKEPIYKATTRGLIWHKSTRDGYIDTPLTNFAAKITADVIEDDGVETRRSFEIETLCNGRTSTFTVPSQSFQSMNWPPDKMGASAIVYPGMNIRDQTRAAIQILSGQPPTKHVYTHTGWREFGGCWAYLHANGAIGAPESVEVSLSGQLSKYALPNRPTGQRLTTALRASLGVLDLVKDEISVPLFSGIYRTVLGACDFSLHLAGTTGVFKSELAALQQQHFGAGMDARNLPGSWTSTDNALEGLLFSAKDALMVLDDFAPTGTVHDVQRLHSRADRILRGQGNNSGRQRMGADTKLRLPKFPRGVILSTGEDIPSGHSLRARMLVLELSRGDIDPKHLSKCQNLAGDGVYAEALSGFIAYIAPRYADIKANLRTQINEFRDVMDVGDKHRRTPEIIANLAVGLHWFLECAVDCGVLTPEERMALWIRGLRGLNKAANAQASHQKSSDPVNRFIELLSAALASGKAHLASMDGGEPQNAADWGWRESSSIGEYSHGGMRPQGDRIGWIDGEDVYLQPDAAHSVARRIGSETGDSIVLNPRTMQKRLHEAGALVTVEKSRGTHTVRRTIGNRREVVLHLHASRLETGDDVRAKTDQTDRTDQIDM